MLFWFQSYFLSMALLYVSKDNLTWQFSATCKTRDEQEWTGMNMLGVVTKKNFMVSTGDAI